MHTDAIDLTALLVPEPEHVKAAGISRQKQRWRGRRFAQIPLEWLSDPAWQRQIGPALRLYLVLQYATKRGARSVRLTNDLAAVAGLDRYHKSRCLRQLEARALVAVHRVGNRNSPLTKSGFIDSV
jgi:hypothetical protein